MIFRGLPYITHFRLCILVKLEPHSIGHLNKTKSIAWKFLLCFCSSSSYLTAEFLMVLLLASEITLAEFLMFLYLSSSTTWSSLFPPQPSPYSTTATHPVCSLQCLVFSVLCSMWICSVQCTAALYRFSF